MEDEMTGRFKCLSSQAPVRGNINKRKRFSLIQKGRFASLVTKNQYQNVAESYISTPSGSEPNLATKYLRPNGNIIKDIPRYTGEKI